MSKAYFQETIQLVAELSTHSRHGLEPWVAEERINSVGLNEIQYQSSKSRFQIFISQFKNAIVILLAVASLISFLFDDYKEALAIIVVILLNAVIGFILESKAHRSMESLKQMDRTFAKVIRNNIMTQIESKYLVPGDLVFVESGDIIPADMRLSELSQLEVDESSLTGESVPIAKITEALPIDTSLADRKNMVFKGTAVTRGNAHGIVVGTGTKTEMGNISRLVSQAIPEEMPLNKKLGQFSYRLIALTIVIIVVFAIIALSRGQDLYLTIETAIALAVAAIPEGLPIVATIALSRGMIKMARHNAIVKNLPAVETLGETDIILTDKTGTLTENRLAVQEVLTELQPSGQTSGRSHNHDAINQVALLCNNASIHNDQEVGDPVEVALLKHVEHSSPQVWSSATHWARIKEIPFDSATRVMQTVYKGADGYITAIKGSPAELLALCSHYRLGESTLPLTRQMTVEWMDETERMASGGLKVIAFAEIHHGKPEPCSQDACNFLGLMGLIDPPRKDVPDALEKCRQAGIRVIMLTGDHPETARAIALQTGMTSDRSMPVVHGKDFERSKLDNLSSVLDTYGTAIYSRVTPAQKMEVITYLQQKGYVVGMTGDGVNDAPALRKADIGIAMGLRGTQVAKEAADMVLQDDSFVSIVKAIKSGRIIFNNIRNFVIYLLSSNLSEVLVVATAAFANTTLPLLPLQILYLNLITDVFPALALGMGAGNSLIMKGKPYDTNEPIVNTGNWRSILGYAIILTMVTMGAYSLSAFYLQYDSQVTNNVAFFTLAFAQLWHPFNLVDRKAPLWNNEITRNPHLWAAIGFCTVLLLVSYIVPGISTILHLVDIPSAGWLIIVIASLVHLPIIYMLKQLRVMQ